MATIEQQVSDHENRLVSLETDKEHSATKADLAQVENRLLEVENRLLWRILAPVMVGIVVSIGVQVWTNWPS